MKRSFTNLLIAMLLLACIKVNAQDAVTVNPLTGSANVTIPIYTIRNGSLTVPINLLYNTNGVKVKDVEGTAGMGWQITGGGQINRELRGTPDDAKKDDWNNYRLGWLYNTNGTKINSLTFANTGTPNCANEAADITNLNNNFSNLSDTEPDIFSVEAPGLSAKFVFDNNHNIKVIPYQDLKISYTVADTTTGLISSFTVINSNGVKYVFNNGDQSYQQTLVSIGTGTGQTVSESNIAYFKNQYLQFKYGIEYSTSWYLSTMTDANGNAISFTYTPIPQQASELPLELYIGSTTKTTQYWTLSATTPKVLQNIYAYDGAGSVGFNYTNNFRSGQPMVTAVLTAGAKYLFNYSSVYSTGSTFYRYFLRDVTTDQCDSRFKYHFTYHDESLSGNKYTTALGDSTSTSIDYWGYQNTATNTDLSPSVNINQFNTSYQRYQIQTDNLSRTDYIYNVAGANRKATTGFVVAGALDQINYVDNGTTSIVYEPNDYYDPTANATVQGGGIRVKQVTASDGLGSGNDIVRNYTYSSGSGFSSGAPLSLPVYAFTKPYTSGGPTAAQWTASTVRSELDLSKDDHTIYYGSVTMSQTGAGKTVYEYYNPATNYSSSASPSCSGCTTEWTPNITNIARPTCTTAGFATNDFDTYPFTPNINYDFERGLLKKVSNYNDAGDEVSESNYSYVRTGAPDFTTALKFDDNSTVKAYLTYKILTSTDELSAQVTNKVFDLNSTTLSKQTAVNYYYGLNHKLPVLVQTTKSDGTIEKNYTTYSKDYTVLSSMTDPYVSALYNLQQQNINIPIENYTQTVIGAGTPKTTSAGVVKFKGFSFGANTIYLPAQNLQFIDQDGVTNFTPSSISSNLFTTDGRYIVVENDVTYDNTGNLQTKNNGKKAVQTVLSDLSSHVPLLVANNATADEIGYYTYANAIGNAQFTKTGTPAGSTAARTVQSSLALLLESNGTLTRTIVRNSDVENYYFSAWINSTTASSLTLTLTGSNGTILTYPLNFTNGGVWKYYETKVSVAALGTGFTAVAKNNAGSNIGIDDILLYPESSEVTTSKYDRNIQTKTAQTNTNGVSQYYVSDNLKRLRLVYDQDKQIIDRKSYSYSDTTYAFTTPVFNGNDKGVALIGTVVTFTTATTYNPCQFVGVTYTWDFGDGTTPVVASTNANQTHAYTAAGTYTVTETVYAPGFGTKSTSYTLTVHPIPQVPVYYTNSTTTGASITSVSFSQGGTVKYTFTGATLSSTTPMINVGTYNVSVKCSGTVGSVRYESTVSICNQSHIPNGTYATVSETLSPGGFLTITLDDYPCN